MSRPVHPVARRLPRDEREHLYAVAHAQRTSVSGLVKGLLRAYLATQPTLQPTVHTPVNRLSDLLSSPPLVRPYRLPRAPGSTQANALRRSAREGERKGLLSDTV